MLGQVALTTMPIVDYSDNVDIAKSLEQGWVDQASGLPKQSDGPEAWAKGEIRWEIRAPEVQQPYGT